MAEKPTLFPPFRRWYRFGWESPLILYKRLRSKYHPISRIRTAYQRVRYGIADSDAWSLDYFLADVTVKGVQKLRKWAHGYPNGTSPEEWDSILVQIERGFQAWLDHDGWFTNTDDEAHFHAAITLYGKWFGALWD